MACIAAFPPLPKNSVALGLVVAFTHAGHKRAPDGTAPLGWDGINSGAKGVTVYAGNRWHTPQVYESGV